MAVKLTEEDMLAIEKRSFGSSAGAEQVESAFDKVDTRRWPAPSFHVVTGVALRQRREECEAKDRMIVLLRKQLEIKDDILRGATSEGERLRAQIEKLREDLDYSIAMNDPRAGDDKP